MCEFNSVWINLTSMYRSAFVFIGIIAHCESGISRDFVDRSSKLCVKVNFSLLSLHKTFLEISDQ
jgi:hypothetical protein